MRKTSKRRVKTASAKRGPKPEPLTIEGDWRAAIKQSLMKKKPPEGWPK